MKYVKLILKKLVMFIVGFILVYFVMPFRNDLKPYSWWEALLVSIITVVFLGIIEFFEKKKTKRKKEDVTDSMSGIDKNQNVTENNGSSIKDNQ